MAAEVIRYIFDLEGAEQAGRQLGDVGDAAKRTQGDLDNFKVATRDSAEELGELEGKAGETSSVMSGLAGAIGIVSPELEGLATGAADAAGGIEAVLRGGPKLAGVMGIIGVALGAAALAWKKYNDELEEAEERQAAAADRAVEVAQAQAEVDSFLSSVELNRAVAFGELDESALQGAVAAQQAEAAFMERKAQIQGDITTEMELQRELQNEINELAHAGDLAGVQATEARKAGVDLRLAQAQKNLAGIQAQETAAAATILETLAATSTGTGGSAGGATGGGTSNPWVDGGLLNKLTLDNPGDAYRFIGGSGGFAGGIYDTDGIEREQIGFGSKFGDRLDNFAKSDGAIAGAGLLSGDPSALLGMIPGGGLISGLASIGAGGASGVRDQLEGFTEAVMAGLEALPEILSEVIPDFATSIVTELIPALIESSPQIFAALITGLANALLPGGNTDQTFGERLVSAGQLASATTGSGGDAADALALANMTTRGRSADSILTPRAPLQMTQGGGAVVRLTAEDIGSLLVDKIDLTIGPNGTRPGHSFGGAA